MEEYEEGIKGKGRVKGKGKSKVKKVKHCPIRKEGIRTIATTTTTATTTGTATIATTTTTTKNIEKGRIVGKYNLRVKEKKINEIKEKKGKGKSKKRWVP